MNSAAKPVSMHGITPTVVRIAALASLVALHVHYVQFSSDRDWQIETEL